ncbi:MAG: hypothetical protein K8S20_11405 [Chloroflexi bacterium]|nr:hypothetical protein [Chloroflexota bacterium]
MNLRSHILVLVVVTLTGCSVPVDQPPLPTALPSATAQPALIVPATFTPISALTQPPTATLTLPAPAAPLSFCDDPHGRELIKSLGRAFSARDGALLASLVSPSNGVDVRYYRDGKLVNYDVEHVKFVFETTFQVDWGVSYGSGQPTLGSFQEIILPSLQKVFTADALIACKEIRTGGATYNPEWPYPGVDYYSVHFPGTDLYGGLDWQTWVVGMDGASDRPRLAALVHYEWEP